MKLTNNLTPTNRAVSSVGTAFGICGASPCDSRRFFRKTVYQQIRNRWYSAELQRFVSRDPLRYDAGDANLYRFAGNDPVNNVDPYGLCVAPFCQDKWDLPKLPNPYRDKVCSFAGGCLNLKFTDYFFNGNGKPTSLASLGVLSEFKNTNAYKASLSKIQQTISQSSECSDNGVVDGNATSEIFSIGKYSLVYNYSCNSGGKCMVYMYMNDPFVDPFRLFDRGYGAFFPAKNGQSSDKSLFNVTNAWNPIYNLGGDGYDIIQNFTEVLKVNKCCM